MRPSKCLEITDECICCDVCKAECPLDCIWEDFSGYEIYLIDQQACNKCEGFYDGPQCIEVCPMDAVIYADCIVPRRED